MGNIKQSRKFINVMLCPLLEERPLIIKDFHFLKIGLTTELIVILFLKSLFKNKDKKERELVSVTWLGMKCIVDCVTKYSAEMIGKLTPMVVFETLP